MFSLVICMTLILFLMIISHVSCSFDNQDFGPLHPQTCSSQKIVPDAFLCLFMLRQVESIVLSIISMLSSPNDESPANVDAAVGVVLFIFP